MYAISKVKVDVVKSLIESGADVKISILESGENGLHISAKRDSKKIAKILLEKGVDIESKTKKGETAYHIAAERGSIKMLDFLDSKGANINATNDLGQTPLHTAVIKKQKMSVYKLLQDAAKSVPDKKNNTPFDYAFDFPDDDEIKLMLADYQEENSLKAVIDNIEEFSSMLDKSKRKAGMFQYKLWSDVIVLGKIEPFEMLIDAKVDVNQSNPINKKTPLQIAAGIGFLDIVKSLLDHGANIDDADIYENTALHVAAGNSKYDIVVELINRGAAVKANSDGESPLDACFESPASDEKEKTMDFLYDKIGYQICMSKITDGPALINFLKKYPEIVKRFGSMLIFNAITYEKETVVEYLLKQGIDPNSVDSLGYTPLHQTAFDDRPAIAEILLKNGADVNSAKTKGMTPLHIAAENEYVDVIKVLVKYNAKLLTNSNGETAVDIANKKNEAGSRAMKEVMKDLILLQNRDLCLKVILSKDLFSQQLKLYPDVHKMFGPMLINKAIEANQIDVIEVLLDAGVSINKPDESGQYPLHLAINLQNDELVSKLISKGADPRIKGIKGRTSILVASAVGSPSIIKIILAENVEYAYDDDNKSPHDLVLESKNEKKAEALKIVDTCAKNIGFKKIKNAEKFIDFVSKNKFLLEKEGASYIEYAVHKKNSQILKFLLDNHVTPNQRLNDGSTILHKAVKEGRYEVAKLLIANGAYVGLSDSNKVTPLHYAAMGSSLDMVNLLIDNGATNRKDNDGKTPIDYAASNASSKSSEIKEALSNLVKYFADMSMVSNYHQFKEVFKTYRMNYAVHSCIRAILYSSKSHVEYMINHGLGVNACNEKGFSLLHFSVPDHIEIATFLLSKGANVNIETDGGYTPLHMACKYKGSEEVVHLLIENGANVNATTSNHITPLFFAVKNCAFSVISALLNKGADPNIRTDNDIAPLDIAVHKKAQEIIDLLVLKGADKVSLEPERIATFAKKEAKKEDK